MLLPILALFVPVQGPPSGPTLVRLWSKPQGIDARPALWIAPGVALTRKGNLSLESGELQASSSTPELMRLLRLQSPTELSDFDPSGTILTTKTVDRWHVFFESGAQRFALIRTPWLQIAQMDARSDEPRRALRLRADLPEYQSVSASPDGGIFLFQSWLAHTGRESHEDEIILRPLRRSPLSFFRYYDISNPIGGVLGVPVPTGVARDDVAMIPYSPDSPLSCGNPYTGKIRWKNPRHEWGHWLGPKYVLASQPWAILDGATGQEIRTDVAELLKDVRDISMIGSYLLIQRRARDGAVQTTGYRLDP